MSLEVSPLLAHDTAGTIAAARTLFAERAGRPNLMIKIPGTAEGLPAIEEAIFAGIPINVTLLFSREHYFAAAEAFLRGIERRIDAGLKPDVASVASVFVSRWDAAVAGTVPDALRNQLGIAMAKRTYKAYRSLLSSPRWQRVYNAGARPQRLLWASTGTKDPEGVRRAVHQGAGRTVHGQHDPREDVERARGSRRDLGLLPANGGDCEEVLAQFAGAGVNLQALAARLQADGAASFVKSWHSLMAVIASKSAALTASERRVRVSLRQGDTRMRVLVVDIGGTNVKILATGQKEPRKFPSGPELTPKKMVAGVKELAADWKYDAVAIGYPGRVRDGRIRDGTAQPRPRMGRVRFQGRVRVSRSES